MRFSVLGVITLLAACAGAAESVAEPPRPIIYTQANAPAPPLLETLALQASVTQYGITWTFDKPARVGQFVNGDWYVVGPVTVVAIDPATRLSPAVPPEEADGREQSRKDKLVRHGSMLNPPAKPQMAFDSGIRNYYAADGLAVFPLTMQPKDALVSTISLGLKEQSKFVYHSSGLRDHHDNCPIKVAAVLTCVGAPQPVDASRPGYCDREGVTYLARNLRRDLLPKLAQVDAAPDPVAFAAVFQRPWLNLGFFGFDQPMENMPHYGQWVGQAAGNAALLLCLDYTPEQKEPLLINVAQVGIDYWSMVKNGHPGWECWGGHGSGRKIMVVVAGHLLGDAAMTSPSTAFPRCEFGEDNQTRYGVSWTGATVVFAGHSGVHSDGKPPREKWGPYEHLHPSQWDQNEQKNFQSEAYRRSNTSVCWVAQGLALRLLGLEKAWAHDAFLDYVDRWMTEDDAEFRKVIHSFNGDKNMIDPSKSWCHQGYAGENWVKTAWQQHRSVSTAPTDGWKKDHGEEAAMLGPDKATTPKKEPKSKSE